jgi:hypothetical protein
VTGRSDDGLDVPLRPVRPPANDRRVLAVLVAAIAVAASGLGLAALSRNDDGPRPTAPRQAAVPTTPPPLATVPTVTPASRRVERFPTLQNQRLRGSPTTVLVRRTGDDAEALAWTAGDPGLRTVARFPGAFAGLPPGSVVVSVAPDGQALLLLSILSRAIEGHDHGRIVTAGGEVVFDSDDVKSLGGWVWSSNSKHVVLAGADPTWWVVAIDGDTATVRAADLRIPRPAAAASPSPDARILPIGFSVDDRWVYGARFDPRDGSLTATMRLAVDDLRVETASAVASTGPDRLDEPSSRGISPTTGRTIAFGANASIPGGPPSIEIRERDGSTAFRVEGGVVVGAQWTAADRLLLLDADGVPFPGTMRLRVVGPDGAVESTPIETGSIADGALIGTDNGFVALLFATDRPERAIQVVIVRIADGTSSALVVPLEEGSTVPGTAILR